MTIEKFYDKIVEVSLDVGERRISKIQEHPRLLESYGLVGLRTKHFLNSLLSEGKLVYLEMGVYRGASLICALYKNPEAKVYAVDNWHYSPIDSPAIKYEVGADKKPTNKTIPWPNVKLAALDNISKYIKSDQITLIEKNFTELTKKDIPEPVDVVHIHPNPSVTKVDLLSYLTTITPLLADTAIIIMEYHISTPVQEAIDSWVKISKIKVDSKHVKNSDSLSNGPHWQGGLGVYIVTKPVVESKK